MTFDINNFAPSPISIGNMGTMIDYSGGDVTLDSVRIKAVCVCSAGDVVYRPRGETSGSITVTFAAGGSPLFHVPGIIFQTGTTATLCTVED